MRTQLAPQPRKKGRSSLFYTISIIGLMAALIGFSKTFFLPMATGEFKAPIAVHMHGFFAFTWVILFVIQTSLIRKNNYKAHRRLGIVGFISALGVTITLVPVALFATHKELAQGLGLTAHSTLLGVITSGLLFFALVITALYYRHRPENHKRLMLLATIVVLWPAWFRFRHFFPGVPNPEVWFALVLADSLIVMSWIWEKIQSGKIHPVLKYVGAFVILEQTFEVSIFDSPAWRNVATWVYHLLTWLPFF
ncbi:MAG: hypothetical protein RIC30_01645 [Marinoscillum sp.]|uniref:hypothetical protein n=1 Tax=Marinoscillum sp. TaxID=2024838 RepID=UPI0032FDF784